MENEGKEVKKMRMMVEVEFASKLILTLSQFVTSYAKKAKTAEEVEALAAVAQVLSDLVKTYSPRKLSD